MRIPPKIYIVLGALLLTAALYSVYYNLLFLPKLLLLMTLGALLEAAVMKIQNKPLRAYGFGSAFAAGLLTCSLPATMPLWQLTIGIAFAALIVKPIFPKAGLRFNSALTARLLLMLLFPADCTAWGVPTIDTLSAATPQELYRAEGAFLDPMLLLLGPIQGSWMDFYTLVPGSPGSNLPLLLIILFMVLSWQKITNLPTALAYALSFSLVNTLCGLNPLYNLITASSLFCMTFLFSDPYSTPKSRNARILFGLIIGLANGLIRTQTYYTEAIVFAVLIANLFTPLLDRQLPPPERTP